MVMIGSPCSVEKRSKLRHPHHRLLVLGDDLAEHPGRIAPGHAGQVDRCLCVAGALQHAAGAIAERKDVARPREIARFGSRVDEGLDRGGAVVGRDAGRRPGAVVDRHGECGPLGLGVLGDHQRQLELVDALGHQWRADHTGGVGEKERDSFGRRELSRHDEVSLVLTVLVVDDDDHLAAPDGSNRLFNCRQRHVGSASFSGGAYWSWSQCPFGAGWVSLVSSRQSG